MSRDIEEDRSYYGSLEAECAALVGDDSIDLYIKDAPTEEDLAFIDDDGGSDGGSDSGSDSGTGGSDSGTDGNGGEEGSNKEKVVSDTENIDKKRGNEVPDDSPVMPCNKKRRLLKPDKLANSDESECSDQEVEPLFAAATSTRVNKGRKSKLCAAARFLDNEASDTEGSDEASDNQQLYSDSDFPSEECPNHVERVIYHKEDLPGVGFSTAGSSDNVSQGSFVKNIKNSSHVFPIPLIPFGEIEVCPKELLDDAMDIDQSETGLFRHGYLARVESASFTPAPGQQVLQVRLTLDFYVYHMFCSGRPGTVLLSSASVDLLCAARITGRKPGRPPWMRSRLRRCERLIRFRKLVLGIHH